MPSYYVVDSADGDFVRGIFMAVVRHGCCAAYT